MVSDRLRRFARRLEGEPDFLAHTLWRHRERTGEGREDTRERLGLARHDEASEISLACCRVPGTPDEVRRVADRYGADAGALRGVLGLVGREPTGRRGNAPTRRAGKKGTPR